MEAESPAEESPGFSPLWHLWVGLGKPQSGCPRPQSSREVVFFVFNGEPERLCQRRGSKGRAGPVPRTPQGDRLLQMEPELPIRLNNFARPSALFPPSLMSTPPNTHPDLANPSTFLPFVRAGPSASPPPHALPVNNSRELISAHLSLPSSPAFVEFSGNAHNYAYKI